MSHRMVFSTEPRHVAKEARQLGSGTATHRRGSAVDLRHVYSKCVTVMERISLSLHSAVVWLKNMNVAVAVKEVIGLSCSSAAGRK